MRTKAALALLTLGITGCMRAAPRPFFAPEYATLGSLELSAAVERDGPDLYGMVEIMNTGDQMVPVEYDGGCAVAIVILGETPRPPRWSSARWWTAHPEVCPASPTRMEIPAQTLARILTPAVGQAAVLGDSIAPGPHQAAVQIRLFQPRDTTLVLRAGPLELRPGAPGGAVVAGARPAGR